MSTFNYDAIEKLFEQLLVLIGGLFTTGELKEVRDFIEASEYGLALQTFVDIVNEEDKRIPRRAATIVEELAAVMEISGEIDLESVRRAAD